MLAIELSTLLVLAGSSFITAAFAVGGLIWVSGRESMVAVPTGSNFAPGKIGDLFPRNENQRPSVQLADQAELEMLRNALAHTPTLIWQRGADGTLKWANAAYITLVKEIDPDAARAWPLPDIFSDFLPHDSKGTPAHRRASLQTPSNKRLWFEIDAHEIGDSLVCSATPIDAAIAAEEKMRSFMQTLTRTFAHLRTGLAIFDRDRRLIIFNPALMDLTELGGEWLSSRPSLTSFFDQLRAKNVLPEPKDYKSWRDRLAHIEEEAAEGQFDEMWSLPDGQVFRVCARPHPDGGLAFMIEDISDEMALTRRFRAELELGQSVINAMDEAVVVFSPTGTQLMANRAYTDMWGLEEDGVETDVAAPSILDANKLWTMHSLPAPLWGEIREFVGSTAQRSEWSDRGTLLDGTLLRARVVPLTGGATLVAFAHDDPTPVFSPKHLIESRVS